MFRHLIVLSSSYKLGKRIALHLLKTDEDLSVFNSLINLDIFKHCTVYSVETDSETWLSVVKYDDFYKDIYVCTDKKEFIDLINLNKDISIFDLSKYILVYLKDKGLDYSQLKLQKLAYFCYEKYLINYKSKLFKEKIYAWKYGPVIKTLYNKTKTKEDLKNLVINLDSYSTRQRIIFSENGLEKLKIIDNVLEKLASLSAKDLTELSHKKGSAWSAWDGQLRNYEITDISILNSYQKN